MPSGVDVTVYDVIGDPPLLAGTVKDIVTCVYPELAKTDVGEPGTINSGVSVVAIVSQQPPSTSPIFLDN
jgi:hypothetical protein